MTLDYALAKELKDAGFPQETKSAYHREKKIEDQIANPTLEELIEACGGMFYSLSREQGADFPSWSAFADDGVDASRSAVGIGRSPSEAVARLWLALSKPELKI